MLLHRVEHVTGYSELELLVEQAFDSHIESVREIGETNFGMLYDVFLPCDPHRVIVKWHKFSGRGLLEQRHLEILRKHAAVMVPEVFYYHAGSEELPFEAVIMEFVPGVPASALAEPDPEAAERLANEMVGILVRWHSVKNPAGYGEIGGPYHPRWLDYYGKRLTECREEMHRSDYALSPAMLDTAERSYGLVERILGGIENDAVLIHSDFWPGNIMIDLATYRITGVIDPLDTEWADRVLDLILLDWPWGNCRHLLELYERQAGLPDDFPLRYAFCEFWYYMKLLAQIGWQTPENNLRITTSLDKALRDYL